MSAKDHEPKLLNPDRPMSTRGLSCHDTPMRISSLKRKPPEIQEFEGPSPDKLPSNLAPAVQRRPCPGQLDGNLRLGVGHFHGLGLPIDNAEVQRDRPG